LVKPVLTSAEELAELHNKSFVL